MRLRRTHAGSVAASETRRGACADVVAAQQKPLKVFFQGSDYGAPRLSGNPEKDVTRAEAALVAHRKRAAQVLDDLAKALGRSVDPVKDKEHIKGLGQLALQWEHLIDEIPDRAPAGRGTIREDVPSREYEANLERSHAASMCGCGITQSRRRPPGSRCPPTDQSIRTNSMTGAGGRPSAPVGQIRATDGYRCGVAIIMWLRGDGPEFGALQPSPVAAVPPVPRGGSDGPPSAIERPGRSRDIR